MLVDYLNEISDALKEQSPELASKLDELVIDHIVLLMANGRFEEAKVIMDNHCFCKAEDGVIRLTPMYQKCRVEIARRLFHRVDTRDEDTRNELTRAIALLEECLMVPENLGEEKSADAEDNDFYFYLGRAFELKGRMMKHATQDYEADRTFSKASKSYRLGTQGYTDIESLTLPLPKNNKAIYAARCFEALGDIEKANKIFNFLSDESASR